MIFASTSSFEAVHWSKHSSYSPLEAGDFISVLSLNWIFSWAWEVEIILSLLPQYKDFSLNERRIQKTGPVSFSVTQSLAAIPHLHTCSTLEGSLWSFVLPPIFLRSTWCWWKWTWKRVDPLQEPGLNVVLKFRIKPFSVELASFKNAYF